MKKLLLTTILLLFAFSPILAAQTIEVTAGGNYSLLMNGTMPPFDDAFGFDTSVSLSNIPVKLGIVGLVAFNSTEVGNINSQSYGAYTLFEYQIKKDRFSINFSIGPFLYFSSYGFSTQSSQASMSEVLIGTKGGVGVSYEINNSISLNLDSWYRKAPIIPQEDGLDISGITISAGFGYSFP